MMMMMMMMMMSNDENPGGAFKVFAMVVFLPDGGGVQQQFNIVYISPGYLSVNSGERRAVRTAPHQTRRQMDTAPNPSTATQQSSRKKRNPLYRVIAAG